MKILVAADLHVSDRMVMGRPRLPVYEEMLKNIYQVAKDNNCAAMVFAGDVIDNKNRPSLDVLVAIDYFLSESYGVPLYWLRGNHETPDKADPTKSIINLYDGRGRCRVVRDAEHKSYHHQCTEEDRQFYFLPWYPAEQFKEEAKALALRADRYKQKTGKKPILFAHIGLKEGSTSPSNFHPPSAVGVADLFPEKWAMVVCGDYHAYQFVAKNVFYTGAPIPHNFGDFNIKGVWVIDTEALTARAVPIPSPKFVQWDATDQEKIPWDQQDYVRIYANPKDIDIIRATYPEADVRAKVPEEQIMLPTDSRISLDASASHEVLLSRYLEYKGVEKDEAECLKAVGLEILGSL